MELTFAQKGHSVACYRGTRLDTAEIKLCEIPISNAWQVMHTKGAWTIKQANIAYTHAYGCCI